MKISIITPCFNAGKLLPQTIDSILSQTALVNSKVELEYIVMDGNSTDETRKIISRYPNITFVSEKDESMYDALSKGLGFVTGDVIGYLNAGDILFPWAFDVISTIFSENNIEWLTGNVSIINSDLVVTSIQAAPRYRREFILNGYYLSDNYPQWIQQESTFWTRNLNNKINLDSLKKYRLGGDYFLWTEFAKITELHAVSAPIGGWLVHPGQLSENKSGYKKEALINTRKDTLREKFTAWWETKCNSYLKPYLWEYTLGKSGASLFKYNFKEERWMDK